MDSVEIRLFTMGGHTWCSVDCYGKLRNDRLHGAKLEDEVEVSKD